MSQAKVAKINSNSLDLDVSVSAVAALPPGIEKIVQLAICGLLVDGVHHKQQILKDIIMAANYDLEVIQKRLAKLGYEWE